MTNPHEAADQFRALFGSAEYMLKRSKFKRLNKDVAEADWEEFAQYLGKPFYEKIIAMGMAKTLVGDPPRQLMAATMEWAPKQTMPLTNVQQLIVQGVCRVRNSYVHGEKFTGGPEGQWERDLTLIKEAHAVLAEALTYLPEPKGSVYRQRREAAASK